jgi:gliding motility-associated-like protein
MEKIIRTAFIVSFFLLVAGCGKQASLSYVNISNPQWVAIGADTSLCSTYPANDFSVWIDFDRIGIQRDSLDSIAWTGGYIDFRQETDSAYLKSQDSGTFHLLFYDLPEIDTLTIQLTPCNYTLYIPSAFSPNEDGLNDVWFPVGTSLTVLYWEIRSPQGEFIFSSDMGEYWDGTWDGNRAASGYYIYRITFRGPLDDEEQHTQGWLELYR